MTISTLKTNDGWQDIYIATGLTRGYPLVIQNVADFDCFIQITANADEPDNKSGVELSKRTNSNSRIKLEGANYIWIRSDFRSRVAIENAGADSNNVFFSSSGTSDTSSGGSGPVVPPPQLAQHTITFGAADITTGVFLAGSGSVTGRLNRFDVAIPPNSLATTNKFKFVIDPVRDLRIYNLAAGESIEVTSQFTKTAPGTYLSNNIYNSIVTGHYRLVLA